MTRCFQDYSKAPIFSLAINRNHPLHIDNDYTVEIWLLSPLVVLYPTTIIYSFLDLLLGITLKGGINLTAILFAEYHNINKIDELLFEYQALVHEIKKNKAPLRRYQIFLCLPKKEQDSKLALHKMMVGYRF